MSAKTHRAADSHGSRGSATGVHRSSVVSQGNGHGHARHGSGSSAPETNLENILGTLPSMVTKGEVGDLVITDDMLCALGGGGNNHQRSCGSRNARSGRPSNAHAKPCSRPRNLSPLRNVSPLQSPCASPSPPSQPRRPASGRHVRSPVHQDHSRRRASHPAVVSVPHDAHAGEAGKAAAAVEIEVARPASAMEVDAQGPPSAKNRRHSMPDAMRSHSRPFSPVAGGEGSPVVGAGVTRRASVGGGGMTPRSIVVGGTGMGCFRRQFSPPEPSTKTGWASTCLSCGNKFAADSQFCRLCAEPRLELCLVDDAFKVYVANRSVMRRSDMSSFTQHVWDMICKTEGVKEHYTYRKVVVGVNKAYDDAFETQAKRERHTQQGLLIEGFEDMLVIVSAMLKKGGAEFLYCLFDEAGIKRELGSGVSGKHAEMTERCHASIAACLRLGKCHRCGNKLLQDSQYCRRCGTPRASFPSKVLRGDFDEIVNLAKMHSLPVEVVRVRKDLFLSCDADGDRNLDMEEFKGVIRDHLGLKDGAPIPENLLQSGWATADKDGSGKIDFEEFLLWSVNTAVEYAGDATEAVRKCSELSATEAVRKGSELSTTSNPPLQEALQGRLSSGPLPSPSGGQQPLA
eukprot:TRINITY_DN123128_c0_g1_i1.p1 TRINITY_DN123128_c0_g1~~TRINITY_DN123128_c0_g1_i1.p1  ORF type:complete len:637 (+),score=98.69 TRINITY_DN123128_c0_g1_i1:30-1913(+)